jgi:hypothetical protein
MNKTLPVVSVGKEPSPNQDSIARRQSRERKDHQKGLLPKKHPSKEKTAKN